MPFTTLFRSNKSYRHVKITDFLDYDKHSAWFFILIIQVQNIKQIQKLCAETKKVKNAFRKKKHALTQVKIS